MPDICLPSDYNGPICLPTSSSTDGSPSARDYAIVVRADHIQQGAAYQLRGDVVSATFNMVPISHAGFDVVNTKTGRVIGHLDAGPGDGGYVGALLSDNVVLRVGLYDKEPRPDRIVVDHRVIVENLTLAEAENLVSSDGRLHPNVLVEAQSTKR